MKTITPPIAPALLAVMTAVGGCAATSERAAPAAFDVNARVPAKAETAPADPPANAAAPSSSAALSPPTSDYWTNIERLRALRIFEVDALTVQVGETTNCYTARTAIGVMCFDAVEAHQAEIAAAEKRVADFTSLAERVAATVTRGGPFGPGVHLEKIRALGLFEIGDFIVDEPESRSCYGFCNPTNQTREAQLDAIVRAL